MFSFTVATMNNAPMNTGMQISLQDLVFISRGGTAGSYSGGSIVNFLSNLHIVLHSDCIDLHSHQQCIRVSFSPQLHEHLLSSAFSVKAILTGLW